MALKTLVTSAIVAGVAAAGCGGLSTRSSSRSTGTSDSERLSTDASPPAPQTGGRSELLPTASIEVSIPTLLRKNEIPRRYTCDGANASLPVRWNGVPPRTSELAIFVVNVQPVHGRLFFDWAVANLNPTSHAISAGTLPPGAVVGRNSFGNASYSICPAKRAGEEHYVVTVLALPNSRAARPGFNAEALYREAERSATAVGLGGGAYTRS
jgi:phosphatidylethanolamine-binding protein (PEBP) family uncharacterized protein